MANNTKEEYVGEFVALNGEMNTSFNRVRHSFKSYLQLIAECQVVLKYYRSEADIQIAKAKEIDAKDKRNCKIIAGAGGVLFVAGIVAIIVIATVVVPPAGIAAWIIAGTAISGVVCVGSAGMWIYSL